MKRIVIGLFLMLLVLTGLAVAEPMLTDGNTAAWIGENNYLLLQNEEGQVRQLMTPVKDLLSFTGTDVLCLMENQDVYAVKRDGTGSSRVYRNATAEQINSLRDQRFTLTEGTLTASEMTLSNSAVAAVTDHRYVYYVIPRGSGFRLMQAMLPEELDNENGTEVANLNGIQVPQPLHMSISPDYLVITAADHSLMVISLSTGNTSLMPAQDDTTAAAALVRQKLYRYQAAGEDRWTMTQAVSMPEMTGSSATAVPTAQVTPVPTATPAPTAVPTATPRVTAEPEPTAESENIEKGASGSDVRSIQKRLDALGYPVGRIDGSYGDDTQLAVNLFYDAIGEKERNYITPEMQDRLFSKSAPAYDPYLALVKGDSGTMVRQMQQRLASLGYDVGKQDGKYGENTITAVAIFQNVIGLRLSQRETQGEKASHDLLERLYAENAPTYRAWKAGQVPLPPAAELRGWYQQGDNWNYYNAEGYRALEWQEIDGKWYFFNDAGIMLTDWQEINAKWYYFDSKGAMVKGWFEDKAAEKKSRGKKIWYWLDENGVMATGWKEIEGQWYYFNEHGIWQENYQE